LRALAVGSGGDGDDTSGGIAGHEQAVDSLALGETEADWARPSRAGLSRSSPVEKRLLADHLVIVHLQANHTVSSSGVPVPASVLRNEGVTGHVGPLVAVVEDDVEGSSVRTHLVDRLDDIVGILAPRIVVCGSVELGNDKLGAANEVLARDVIVGEAVRVSVEFAGGGEIIHFLSRVGVVDVSSHVSAVEVVHAVLDSPKLVVLVEPDSILVSGSSDEELSVSPGLRDGGDIESEDASAVGVVVEVTSAANRDV